MAKARSTELYIRNRGPEPADVKVTVHTEVVYPEVRAVLITALGVFGVFFLYFLQATIWPRLSAIALATFKSEVAQPLFMIILILGTVILLISIYIPYNTLGEDIKMLKDSGLELIRIFGIILAAWGASTTLADEIEGRTALTVLSKPVRRRSFVIGKFFGIGWTTGLMFLVLGAVLLAATSYKVIYDCAGELQRSADVASLLSGNGQRRARLAAGIHGDADPGRLERGHFDPPADVRELRDLLHRLDARTPHSAHFAGDGRAIRDREVHRSVQCGHLPEPGGVSRGNGHRGGAGDSESVPGLVDAVLHPVQRGGHVAGADPVRGPRHGLTAAGG